MMITSFGRGQPWPVRALMMAVTVVRISGARLVAARKKPNITQMKPCQTFSPA